MAITTVPDTQELFDGTGSKTAFSFAFVNSFEEDDVFVYVWNATTSQWDKKELTTDYTQSGSNITFVTAPPSGTKNVMICRKTDIVDPKHDYQPGSSIRAQDLDNNQRQVIQKLQELEHGTLTNVNPTLQGNLELNNFNITQGGDAVGSLHTGDTPPTNPVNGSRWFDTSSGRTYIYYTDADSSAWVDTTPTYVQVGTSDEAVPKAGGTMTGFLTLHSNPTSNLHAATKQYVDGVTGLSDGDKGDITVANSGASWTIEDNAVDAAAIADNAVGLSQLDGIARGKIIYGDASGNPAVLAPGGSGQVLKSDGTDISWGAVSGSGTVTAITPGTGILHGSGSSNITSTGTLNVDVGTTANKVLQLDGNAKIPAVDGSQLTNVSTTVADNAVTLAKLEHGNEGDILYYAASGTPTRLAKGTAGKVLAMNSGATAPEWAASAGNFKLGDEITLSPDQTVSRSVTKRMGEWIKVQDFTADDGSSVITKGLSATNAQITKNTEVFQNALDTGNIIHVPGGKWLINDTLTINKTGCGLIGDGKANTEIILIVADNTAAPKSAIKIQSTGSAAVEFCVLENLYIKREVATDTTSGNVPAAAATEPVWPTTSPTTNYAGVALDGSNWSGTAGGVNRARINNLRISGFVTGIAATQVVDTKISKCYVQQPIVYSSTSYNGYHIGYHFIGDVASAGGMSPFASTVLTECSADMEGTKNYTWSSTNNFLSFGFFLDGDDLRDISFYGCETVHAENGWKLQTTNSDDNWNIRINDSINDAFKGNAIRINALNGTGAVSINGGYGVGKAGSGSAIYVNSSNGITVSNYQFLGLANDDSELDIGISLVNSTSCSITGNRFLNCRDAIYLNNSSYNAITSNVISAAAISTGTANTAVTLDKAIHLFGSSSYNTITANTIRGLGTGTNDQYDYGIIFDGSNVANNVGYGNRHEASTIQYDTTNHINNASTTTNTLDAGGSSSSSSDNNFPITGSNITNGANDMIYQPQDNHIALKCNNFDRIYQYNVYTLIGGYHTSPWAQYNERVQIDGDSVGGIGITGGSTGGQTRISFYNPNGRVGYIGTSGSSTSYNQSSDYRLKENQVPIVGALAKLLQLKPYTFNWIADPKTKATGFFAHEIQKVLPEAVSGEKDGKEMQAVDYSKVVPLLTAAVQELTDRVKALEGN